MPKGVQVKPADRAAIVELRRKGMSYKEIASKFGIIAKTASHIVKQDVPRLYARMQRLGTLPKQSPPEQSPAATKTKKRKKAASKKRNTKRRKESANQASEKLRDLCGTNKALASEVEYLRWAYAGAVNGWIDRLIEEHSDGSLG